MDSTHGSCYIGPERRPFEGPRNADADLRDDRRHPWLTVRTPRRPSGPWSYIHATGPGSDFVGEKVTAYYQDHEYCADRAFLSNHFGLLVVRRRLKGGPENTLFRITIDGKPVVPPDGIDFRIFRFDP